MRNFLTVFIIFFSFKNGISQTKIIQEYSSSSVNGIAVSISGSLVLKGVNQKSVSDELNQGLANVLDSILIHYDSLSSCQINVRRGNFKTINDTIHGYVSYDIEYFKSDSLRKKNILSDYSSLELLYELSEREKKPSKITFDKDKFIRIFDEELKKKQEDGNDEFKIKKPTK